MKNIQENLAHQPFLTTHEHVLLRILELQEQNLEVNLTAEEITGQGFVTVKHDLDLLRSICGNYGHVTAFEQEKLVAYALVMLPRYAQAVPVLLPMFKMLNRLSYAGSPIREQPYFVMGQICVDKAYRGRQLVPALYQTMRRQLSGVFKYVITEVACRNTRSLRAHKKIGFQCIHHFTDATDDWQIILWDWQNNVNHAR